MSSFDETWLLAREQGATQPHPDPEREAQYVRLEAQLRELPELQPPAGWERRLFAALPPDAPTPLPGFFGARAAAAGVSALVAALLLLMLAPPSGPQYSGPISMSVQAGGVALRGAAATAGATRSLSPGSSVAVGETLTLSFELPGELRLYRGDGTLVARCPGDRRCSTKQARGGRSIVTLAVLLEVPGSYRTIVIRGPPMEPTGRGLSADLEAADAARATLLTEPPIIVQ